MTSSTILEVKSLQKKFKTVQAVHDISFSLEKGDIFAFLGPNGAGKTTTLRILLDIIKADQGSISWHLNGYKGNLPPSHLIGYLPEERGLYLDLPVIRSLVYLASIRGMPAAEAKTEAMKWLERLELADRANEKLQALSKGNQQKIQFVASVLHKPAFAILDEPFSGLDPINQERFLEYIKELNNMGTTILLSSHQMPLVEKIAHKVFLINHGKEVYHGSLNRIYEMAGLQTLEITFEQGVPENLEKMLPEVQLGKVISDQKALISFDLQIPLNKVLSDLTSQYRITHVKSGSSDLHDLFVSMIGQKQPQTLHNNAS